MSIAWLAPVAFAGLALTLLPIAIHLLVRQHAARVMFPSLRFLQQTQLPSFRLRRIEDPWLLLLRVAIVATAVAALAGPVWQSTSRQVAAAQRVSRAVVEIGDPPQAVAPLRESAFRSTAFRRVRVGDAIDDAVRWLEQQPPSAREIVIAGGLRRGAVVDADLARIPADVGVRFLQGAQPGAEETSIAFLARRNGSLVRIDSSVRLSTDSTLVGTERVSPVAGDLVRISGKDQVLADAALAAALNSGVPWNDFSTPMAIRLPDDATAADAAEVVLVQLQRASTPELTEPVVITPEQLTKWTRAPGAPSPNAPLSDEGDRRWLWAAVLMLLAVESWWRRSRASRSQPEAEEARVA